MSRLYAAPIWALLCVSCGGQEEGVPQDPAPGSRTSDLIERAALAFEQAVGRTYPNPTPRMALIRQTLRDRDGRRARELIRMELNEHPGSAEALLVDGQLFYQRTALSAARARFEIVLELGPTFEGSEKILYLYGVCLLRLGESDHAREALLAHLNLKPDHDETLYSLGELALQSGQPQEAIPYIEQALDGFKTNKLKQGDFKRRDIARAHSSLGTAYMKLDDLERARESFETSLQLDPNDIPTQYSLSRVLSRMGDEQGAQRAMERYQQMYAQRAARNSIPIGQSRGKAGGGR